MEDVSNGYIALYRKFIDWEWFTDINTCHLFLYCLLLANHKDKNWRGKIIEKGSFITSYEHLAKGTGLTVMQVRTALNKLKLTNEITHKTTSQYSIIVVKNYAVYQENNKQLNKQNNKRITTTNKEDIDTTSYINISLSIEEREILENYIKRKCKSVVNADAYIHKLTQNGDYKRILEKEKQRLQRLEEKKKQEEGKRKEKEEEPSEQDEEKIAEIQKRIRENFKKRRTK